jgi:site-specific recombinase XerD
MAEDMTPEQVVRDWELDLTHVSGLKAGSVSTYGYIARAFLTHSGGEFTRRSLRSWMANLSEPADATRQLYQIVLRSLARWMIQEGLIEDDPTVIFRKIQVTPKRVQPFTKDEVDLMLAAALEQPPPQRGYEPHAYRDHAIIQVLYATGMRSSECAGIELSLLDLDDANRVHITGKGDRGGSKVRRVPLDPKTVRAIRLYIRRERNAHPKAPDPHLWLTRRGVASRQTIDTVVHDAGFAAGVKNAYPHRFRHTLAHDWMKAGKPEQGLMKIAGWTDRRMLDRYSDALAEDRAEDAYRSWKR